MAISRQEKQALVKEYEQNLDSSRALFLAHYTGLTVGQMERVREAMAREETRVEVLRNRLFLIAAQQAGKEAAGKVVDGPTLAVFCLGDPTSPAKTLSGFTREMEGLAVYGGLLGQSILGAEEFQQLANLPSREELLGQVVGGLQAPIYGLVSVLGGVLRSMLYVLQARIDQLEGQAS